MECEIKRSDGVEVTDEQRRFGRNAITNAMNGGATALAYPEDWDASTDMKIGDMIEFNKKWKDCPNVWNFSQYGPIESFTGTTTRLIGLTKLHGIRNRPILSRERMMKKSRT